MGESKVATAATWDITAIEKMSDQENMEIINCTMSSNSKYAFKYVVYELYDASSDAVKYVGRTRQSLNIRQKQHWKADSLKNGLDIRVASYEGKYLEDLTYAQARGFEHLAYEFDNKTYKLLN
jgi:hypothetical protein